VTCGGGASGLDAHHRWTAALPGRKVADRRVHECLPIEHRRSAERGLGGPPHRNGRVVHLVHIYRPVGRMPAANWRHPGTATSRPRFVVDLRVRNRYRDRRLHDATASSLPSVIGFTHHINPWATLSPCRNPVRQRSIHDPARCARCFRIRLSDDYRQLIATHTRGCVVLERRTAQANVTMHGARMPHAARPGRTGGPGPAGVSIHPGHEIPERSCSIDSPSGSPCTSTARTRATITARIGATRWPSRATRRSWNRVRMRKK